MTRVDRLRFVQHFILCAVPDRRCTCTYDALSCIAGGWQISWVVVGQLCLHTWCIWVCALVWGTQQATLYAIDLVGVGVDHRTRACGIGGP